MKKDLVSTVIVTRNRRSDLIRCIKSLKDSTYKQLEIIVVDNGSTKRVTSWAKRLFPEVNFVRSKQNLGAAGGRNFGKEFAKGNYLLFVDDDAQIDKEMISELISVLTGEKNVGIVQPKIYDMEKRNTLQGIGCDINLLTGRVSSVGIREEDKGQYDSIKDLQSVGCIWMVKRIVFEKIGGYDEEYFIPWEDTDFSFRARKAGLRILFEPKALAWHRGPKSTFVNPIIDFLGIRSEDRAYRIGRNKIIFMRKHAKFMNFIFFLLMVLPLNTFVHSLIITLSLRIDLLLEYWRGIFSGLTFAIFYTYKKDNLRI